MDRHKVNDVAWFAPIRRRGGFVGRKIYRVQDIPEHIVTMRGEKPKRAVRAHRRTLG